jgi:hypothetical protein
MSSRSVRLLVALTGAAVLAALAGCAPTVAMDPAAGANNPKCADVTVRLPDSVAGKAERQTDAQATGAWGDPTVVLLRCGVTPIGPTTKPCVTVNGIDWVLTSNPSATTIRYITFGRVPATEVIISHGKGGVSDASVLPDFASAIGSIKQTHKCIGQVAAPSATPAPTP